ncbi:hypothetical protein [Paenibacillus mucilaginosus]|uniref:Uncharacterized protein n=3 Tax=Paenibacillus mucilaginosus TaxID=61624 RepID=H6NM65_9BACL|nr:hypothetical protein [Paenibacillus mucilaginosus]AEI45529.1 hypothetical protein KNP414_07017 [Paenibacillus mucilaginosus KNP414]AFC33227.1 hypothetical protein PM3016_6612 [Paenibacillus mucilaginosus 3016]AFH65543.1 hypothetical protein B2K_33405 [Paenibacillus mucilaginosus K02]MCG7215284.1 hypothetical protein [Paenibacillus mucilaginosus]WDM26949.1 hypothetical protein KCX80_31840 [Paenibacillus mucilaginosus]
MDKRPLTTHLFDTLIDLQEDLIREVLPREARTHFLAARREALLGIRSLLDEAIERTREREQRQGDPTQGPGKRQDPASPGTIPIED